MIINNFSIIRQHLTFTSDFDRYIIHIIKRSKDDKGKMYGVNETNRLLKTFYITSLEYFDKKIPVIKDLCESNNARAYILPQVRDNSACLKQLLKLVVDNLDNPTQKPDHLIRSAYCGYHSSRDKKWILDLDNDNMIEYRHRVNFGGTSCWKIEWTPEKVLEFVQKQLEACGKSKDSAYLVPTRNGHCLVTSPFNLQKAYQECEMFFTGEHTVITDIVNTPNSMTETLKPNRTIIHDMSIHGWLIKDGMVLLFYNDGNV